MPRQQHYLFPEHISTTGKNTHTDTQIRRTQTPMKLASKFRKINYHHQTLSKIHRYSSFSLSLSVFVKCKKASSKNLSADDHISPHVYLLTGLLLWFYISVFFSIRSLHNNKCIDGKSFNRLKPVKSACYGLLLFVVVVLLLCKYWMRMANYKHFISNPCQAARFIISLAEHIEEWQFGKIRRLISLLCWIIIIGGWEKNWKYVFGKFLLIRVCESEFREDSFN